MKDIWYLSWSFHLYLNLWCLCICDAFVSVMPLYLWCFCICDVFVYVMSLYLWCLCICDVFVSVMSLYLWRLCICDVFVSVMSLYLWCLFSCDAFVSVMYLFIYEYIRHGRIFELIKFWGDNVYKRVLIADNVKETGKIKTLQTTDSVWTFGHGYLWRKMSENGIEN